MKILASQNSLRLGLLTTLCLSALCLSALSCGGSSDDSEPNAEESAPNLIADQLPIDTNADPNQGSMLDPRELVEGDQCDTGWLQNAEDVTTECAATFGGLCFEDNDAACECAGCSDDACLILESYPTQIQCESISLESL